MVGVYAERCASRQPRILLSPGTVTAVYASVQLARPCWRTFVSGTPSKFSSSARGAREFCANCGTQIAFRASQNPRTVDVNVGALAEPARFPPEKHIYCKSAIPWLSLEDELPRFEAGPPAAGA